MADGQVVFEITADGRHAKAAVDDVVKAMEKAGKKVDATTKETAENAEKNASNAIKNILAAISAAAIAKKILDIGKAAVQAASDLEEVQNVVEVTFGEGASQIESWAKRAGTQFGLTETQAKRFASTMGAMMKSAGLAGPEIISMSTDLAGLAADMASFYNLDFETAFQKIRSGIAGETEPLKQLGINMSVANLEAYALSKGITTAFDKMSQGEQTMLRYQYLMQATADAQGDFARTSDGLANGLRMLETNFEQIKTTIGSALIPVVSEAVSSINGFLQTITQGKPQTVLDEFAAIDLQTETKLSEISATKEQAETLLELLKEINGTPITLKNGESTTYEALFGDLAEIKQQGGSVEEYLQNLGLNVSDVTAKYQRWLTITGRLVNTIPGLNEVINTETGELNGGISAIENYVDAWDKAQKEIAYKQALQAKKAALASKEGDLFASQLDVDVARKRANALASELQSILSKAGLSIEDISNGTATELATATAALIKAGVDTTGFATMVAEYKTLSEQAFESATEFERQKEAYESALEEYGLYEEAVSARIGELTEETEGATEAVRQWTQAEKDAATAAVTAANTAFTALNDYIKAVRDETEQTVKSIISGFDEVLTPTQRKLKELQEQYDAETDAAKKHKIMVEINAVTENGTVASAEDMIKGLQSQLDYIAEYQRNLDKARERGVSDLLLSSLSDGSVESAEYLAALANADEDQIEDLNRMYAEVQAQSASFTDALTAQKLEADEAFKGLLATATETVEQLALAPAAEDAMRTTVEGIAQGIADAIPDVQTQVNSLMSVLGQLNTFNMNIGIKSRWGSLWGDAFRLNGSHANGLDYVPFDNYLAQLHEGESILTAEEAKVWRDFKYGQKMTANAIDYDALSGALRSSGGGNVYLDGQTVGRVISARQADSLRAMERSGWKS